MESNKPLSITDPVSAIERSRADHNAISRLAYLLLWKSGLRLPNTYVERKT
jgi:hypothetical protein